MHVFIFLKHAYSSKNNHVCRIRTSPNNVHILQRICMFTFSKTCLFFKECACLPMYKHAYSSKNTYFFKQRAYSSKDMQVFHFSETCVFFEE